MALAGLAVLSVIPLRGHALTYLAGGPAIATLTALLLLSWRTWTEVTTPALRALVWLGTVSYAAYLWNYPLTLWLRPYTDLAGPLAAALTLAVAALSWRLVEQPLTAQARGGDGMNERLREWSFELYAVAIVFAVGVVEVQRMSPSTATCPT